MGGKASKLLKNDKKKKENVESDITTHRTEQGARDAENRRTENNVTSKPGREERGRSAPTQGRGNSDPENGAGTSSSSGNEATTSQGQENNTAKRKKEPERRDENSSSPSGDNAKQEDTKTKPPPSSAALPEGGESEGTSTSSHNQETTEPENPASPSSESPIEGNKEDITPTTTKQGQEIHKTAKGKKEEPERRDENSSSPSGDNAKQEETMRKIKPPPSFSQSGEHAQLKMGTGVTVTSTPGPGDPGTSTPTSHHLETTNPGEMSDPSSLRTKQHRSGEKTSSDHGRDPTTCIPDSVPPPQPQGEVRGHRSVIPPRNRKRTATGAETEPREQTRAVIFSLEEDDGVKSLEKWTRRFIPDCQHISPATTKDWRAAVETSAIVIVYSSSSCRSFTEKMGPFMDHWKGYEKVIAVIGDVPASEDAVRSGWDGVKSTCSQRQSGGGFSRTPGSRRCRGRYGRSGTLCSENRRVVTIFVGITPLKKAHWLEPLLRDDEKVDFRVSLISEIKDLLSKWREPGLTCILHFPKGTFQKNITEADSVLRLMMEQKGKKPLSVVVVVDDLDDESSEKHLRALYNKSGYSGLGPLFLFRREERGPEYQDYVSSYGEVEVTAKEKWRKLQKSMETRLRRPESCDTSDATPRPPQDAGEEGTRTTRNLGVVGIFSRSSNTDYSWMETVLRSPDLAPVVSEVRPFYISNNQTKRFFKELGRCSFGILYHTKNRGGVNVTDVADSLYDEELEAMSQILNRENVIVVIDDLRDSHIEEKGRILKTQPSIDRYAFDLLLFSEREKKDGDHEERLTEAIMSLAAGRKTAVKKDDSRPSYTR